MLRRLIDLHLVLKKPRRFNNQDQLLQSSLGSRIDVNYQIEF